MKAFTVLTLVALFHLSLVDGEENKDEKFSELRYLNAEQKAALAKLKESCSDKLPHDYMKEDIYLVKFLQSTQFNAKKAEDMLKKSIDFRKKNKVDNWEDKDFFGKLEKDYPFRECGVDKKGRPVQVAHLKDWNIKKSSGNSAMTKLTHYALRPVERSNAKNREMHAQGQNNTQFMLIWDLEGFSTKKHACPSCMKLYVDYTKLYEANWPNSFHRVVVINAPKFFEKTYSMFKPFMSEKTASIYKVFDSDKDVWWAYLEKYIEVQELEKWFEKYDEDMPTDKKKDTDNDDEDDVKDDDKVKDKEKKGEEKGKKFLNLG